eukprot:RCo055288
MSGFGRALNATTSGTRLPATMDSSVASRCARADPDPETQRTASHLLCESEIQLLGASGVPLTNSSPKAPKGFLGARLDGPKQSPLLPSTPNSCAGPSLFEPGEFRVRRGVSADPAVEFFFGRSRERPLGAFPQISGAAWPLCGLSCVKAVYDRVYSAMGSDSKASALIFAVVLVSFDVLLAALAGAFSLWGLFLAGCIGAGAAATAAVLLSLRRRVVDGWALALLWGSGLGLPVGVHFL